MQDQQKYLKIPEKNGNVQRITFLRQLFFSKTGGIFDPPAISEKASLKSEVSLKYIRWYQKLGSQKN